MKVAGTSAAGVIDLIRRENLEVYRASPGRLREDVSQEAQVAHDYRGRLIYELLQNADDAFVAQPSANDRALFRLTDRELWVANTGRPFSDEDVRGLCGLGSSSKAVSDGPKRASIGHKGLGFKSVLEITETPEAYSETVSFQLGRQHARPAVEELWTAVSRGAVADVPAMRFPSEDFSHDPGWQGLQANGYRSAFRFPFMSSLPHAERRRLADALLSFPMSSVLFLKHLEEVTIEVATEAQQGTREWVIERSRVHGSGQVERCAGLTGPGLYLVDLIDSANDAHSYWIAHDSDVRIGDYRDGLSGPAWDGVDVTEVSIAVRDAGDPRIAVEDRRFHVFLPTQEPAACSLLVNAAFVTDLSRKHVQVSPSAADYNAHLIRRAAETFGGVLLPHLLHARDAAFVLRALEPSAEITGDASAMLRDEFMRVLSDAPMLPSDTGLQSLSSTVLPSPVLGDRGVEFADLLTTGTTWGGRSFPLRDYCAGDLAAVSAEYGAQALTPTETLIALATGADRERARAQPDRSERFKIDPVLEVCTALWESADADDRDELEGVARMQPVFPTRIDQDGVIHRIALGDQIAFYPPRSASDDLPLRRLKFLAHDICWGTLKRTEQGRVLEGPMKAWSALFDMKDFRFEEVMRAAVLPGLARTNPDEELRAANRSFDALAAICRLAGSTTKPEQPLPMGRLGSDRAFFNLSRLEVPCRAADQAEIVWMPAHRVYFGEDWVQEQSVARLSEAMADAGTPLPLHFLAPPSAFREHFDAIMPTAESAADQEDVSEDVDIEADTDEAMETTPVDRWRNFFLWLGVSRSLRLIHFHDVDDEAGWITTKGLEAPRGWAFQGLDEVWSDYRVTITDFLQRDKRWTASDRYLYRVHTLDHLGQIAPVAERADTGVSDALFEHLARNWSSYARYVHAEIALVGEGRYPSQRAKPPRAWSEELAPVGPDFWLYRLRSRAVCPTSHGPRRPGETWRNSEELRRRFDGRGRRAKELLPVLKSVPGVTDAALRPFLDALQVRGELVPATFAVSDARNLVERVATLYGSLGDQVLRMYVRPIYREMFALLVGAPTDEASTLRDVPMAANTPDGLAFLPSSQVIYASVSGSRERSGVQDRINLFVIEAESSALRPLRDLFGMPLLERALSWQVPSVVPALDDEQLQTFRAGLLELVPPLLARMSADRADQADVDRRILLEFAQRVEPVEQLRLRVSLHNDGVSKDLGEVPGRDYYVETGGGEAMRALVVWSGQAWPPAPEDAQTLAMALADALGVNTVETFLSFINASDAQRRKLLDLAGAAGRLDIVMSELNDSAESDLDDPQRTSIAALTDGTSIEPETRVVPAPGWTDRAPDPPKVPLYRFEDLSLEGELLRVAGETPRARTTDAGADDPSEPAADDPAHQPNTVGPRAGSGTDRSELDRLGMRITIAFEKRRLGAVPVAVLPGDPPSAGCRCFVVDASEPAMIEEAARQSALVKAVLDQLAAHSLSLLFPGFDILTIADGEVDRMIELKSSGLDARIQEMSWNEWKTAGGALREKFWLYLVGNLRADMTDAQPFIRAVQDPFGTLASSEDESVLRKRSVQLRVREFGAADELTLGVHHSRRYTDL